MSDQVVHRFTVNMTQVEDYEFRVRFDKEQYEDLYIDEPAPLGHDEAPNAVRVLAAAIGNCLSASLMFCMQKNGQKVTDLTAAVEMEIVRNEHKRLRVGNVKVILRPPVALDDEALVGCRDKFEDFCTVTQSVRRGIDIDVSVEPVG
jgi:uncharacterized OsmC-like protein